MIGSALYLTTKTAMVACWNSTLSLSSRDLNNPFGITLWCWDAPTPLFYALEGATLLPHPLGVTSSHNQCNTTRSPPPIKGKAPLVGGGHSLVLMLSPYLALKHGYTSAYYSEGRE